MASLMEDVKDIDDLYSGFDNANDILDQDLGGDEGFVAAVKSSYGNRPIKTGQKRLQTGRIGTAAIGGEGGATRPMTAKTAAGFRRQDANEEEVIDIDEAPPLVKNDETPDDKLRALEANVNKVLEESALLAENREWNAALDKAKTVLALEKQLTKLREEDNPDSINFDLTYSVMVHYASLLQRADMPNEALHAYQNILKNKAFDRAGRLRINMGNIYFSQKKYLQAVKMYRMALDQLPYAQQRMRNKVLRNIGHCFVLMGQYTDSISSYEHVLEQRPTKEIGGQEKKMPGTDFKTAFNALLCYFAIGERERMKRGFQTLLAQQLSSSPDDERYQNLDEDPHIQLVLDVIKTDSLSKRESAEKLEGEGFIVAAAKLIAPVIESSFASGFDWCIEQVRQSSYAHIGAELEITKAVAFLKMKEFKKAVQALKQFEKDDSKMQSAAATNLSFLYFLESKYAQADKYADQAIQADKYNASALVNKGNCIFIEEQYDNAIEIYREALAVDSSCNEALFNMGLAYKRQGAYEYALECFHKLHNNLQNSPEVIYQLAHCYEELQDLESALDWFKVLLSLIPTDPDALAHVGNLFDLGNDKSSAFQHHYEAFRYFPSSIKILEWLGAYYIESQFPEKAIQYFKRAADVQPLEVKWRMMVASCYRRSGDYQAAFAAYKQINKDFPDNLECLKFLVRISTDLGMTEVQEYTILLQKAERARENREQREANGRSRSGRKRSGNRRGSASRRSSGGTSRPTSVEASAGQPPPPLPVQVDDAPAPAPAMARRAPADASYEDPIGKLPERPRTAAVRKVDDDDWGDEDAEDLLPD